MKDYVIDRNNLIVSDVLIEFKYPILETILIADILIVLVESPYRVIYNENVFGVSLATKSIMWQIKKVRFRTPGAKDCPYTSIVLYQGKLHLNNWCDTYFIINPVTGAVIEKGQTR